MGEYGIEHRSNGDYSPISSWDKLDEGSRASRDKETDFESGLKLFSDMVTSTDGKDNQLDNKSDDSLSGLADAFRPILAFDRLAKCVEGLVESGLSSNDLSERLVAFVEALKQLIIELQGFTKYDQSSPSSDSKKLNSDEFGGDSVEHSSEDSLLEYYLDKEKEDDNDNLWNVSDFELPDSNVNLGPSRVISSQTELQNLYGDQPIPDVDFDNQTLVLLSQRTSTPGYQIYVHDVDSASAGANISYSLSRDSSSGDMQAQVTGYANRLIAIPKVDGEVSFNADFSDSEIKTENSLDHISEEARRNELAYQLQQQEFKVLRPSLDEKANLDWKKNQPEPLVYAQS